MRLGYLNSLLVEKSPHRVEAAAAMGASGISNGDNMTISLQKISAATAGVALAMGVGLSGAQATSVELETTDVISEAPMEFIGFDKKVAAENGYDIRKDGRGIEYSIPASTPKGDMTGAVYGPGTEPKPSGDFTTMDWIEYGDCGTSQLLGDGKSFSTGYTIHWYLGPSAHHKWRVVVSSGYGYQVFNLDGYFGGNQWLTSRAISFKGLPYNAYVSSGQVVTAAGFVCGSMSPDDSWYGY